jgi:hypothetical protein
MFMACSLTKIGPMAYSAPENSVVTITIRLTTDQYLAAANYNNTVETVADDDLTAKFTVVKGECALALAIAGHQVLAEDLEVAEVCASGGTFNHLYGYRDSYESDINFKIVGV